MKLAAVCPAHIMRWLWSHVQRDARPVAGWLRSGDRRVINLLHTPARNKRLLAK